MRHRQRPALPQAPTVITVNVYGLPAEAIPRIVADVRQGILPGTEHED